MTARRAQARAAALRRVLSEAGRLPDLTPLAVHVFGGVKREDRAGADPRKRKIGPAQHKSTHNTIPSTNNAHEYAQQQQEEDEEPPRKGARQ